MTTKLLINNKEIDLDAEEGIEVIYQIEDYDNPTNLKDNITHSLNIKGTKNNNKIFGSYFNIDSSNSSVFNPTADNSFQLFQNNNLIFSGTIELNSVDIVNKDYVYNISLVGEKVNFFKELDIPMQDIYKNTDQHKVFSLATVYSDFIGTNDLNPLVSFPSYQGAYENFANNKFGYATSASAENVTELNIEKDEHSIIGYNIKDNNDKEINKYIKDFRWYKQFMAFRVYNYMQMVRSYLNDKGYTLKFEGELEKPKNLFWTQSRFTLPYENYDLKNITEYQVDLTMPTIDLLPKEKKTISLSASTTTPATPKGVAISKYGALSGKFLDNGIVSKVNFGSLAIELITNEDIPMRFEKVQMSGNVFDIWFEGKLIYSCDKKEFIRDTETNNKWLYSIKAGSIPEHYISQTDLYRPEITVLNADTIIGESYIGKYAKIDIVFQSIKIIPQAVPFINNMFLKAEYQTQPDIYYKDILPKDIKCKDFLLSISKMYNLIWDVKGKEVILSDKNYFYRQGKVVDFNGKNENKYTIVPTANKNKCFQFKYKTNNTQYIKSYRDKRQIEYGQIEVYLNNVGKDTKTSTNQQNVEKIDIMKDVIFNNFTNSSEYDTNFKFMNDRRDVMDIPDFFKVDGNKRVKEYPGMCLMMDNLGLDVNYDTSLFTGNNFQFRLTDLSTTQILNKEGRFIYATSTSYSPYAFFNKFRSLRKYFKTNENIIYSLDYGVPDEYFSRYEIPNNPIGSNNTKKGLYHRFYKNFFNDKYDVNSKIIKCKFNISDSEMSQISLKDFIYFENNYWSIQKIVYTPNSDTLPEFTLLKVKDMDNYKYGQEFIESTARIIVGDSDYLYLTALHQGGNRVMYFTNSFLISSQNETVVFENIGTDESYVNNPLPTVFIGTDKVVNNTVYATSTNKTVAIHINTLTNTIKGSLPKELSYISNNVKNTVKLIYPD